MESETDKLKPFKLCFRQTQALGRSNIAINQRFNIGKQINLDVYIILYSFTVVVTGKFYSKYEVNTVDEQIKIVNYMEKLRNKTPREKYEKPLTENQW